MNLKNINEIMKQNNEQVKHKLDYKTWGSIKNLLTVCILYIRINGSLVVIFSSKFLGSHWSINTVKTALV